MAKKQQSPRTIFIGVVEMLLRENDSLSTPDLYERVKMLRSGLCDDNIMTRKGNEPKWKHTVRLAVWSLSARGIIIEVGNRWKIKGR